MNLFVDSSVFYAAGDSSETDHARAVEVLSSGETLVTDQDFSIVDRTSFAVMERLRVSAVASFDNHFAVYRFGPRRERAFEIQR